MKRLSSREMLILIVTIVLSVLFITYQWGIRPIQEGALDINDRLRLDRAKLIKAQEMLAKKSQVEDRYRHLVNLVGVADSDETEMPTIVAKIENAARESNIHIANIQPQRSSTQNEARFLAVEIEIDGQWLDIVQFLRLLQQQPNFYFIDELNLEKYSDAANSLRGRIVVSRMSLVDQ